MIKRQLPTISGSITGCIATAGGRVRKGRGRGTEVIVLLFGRQHRESVDPGVNNK